MPCWHGRYLGPAMDVDTYSYCGTQKVWDENAKKVGFYADVTSANPLGVPSSLDEFSTSAQETSTSAENRSFLKAAMTATQATALARKSVRFNLPDADPALQNQRSRRRD